MCIGFYSYYLTTYICSLFHDHLMSFSSDSARHNILNFSESYIFLNTILMECMEWRLRMSARFLVQKSFISIFFLTMHCLFLFIIKNDVEVKCFPLFLSTNNLYLLFLHIARLIPASYPKVIVQFQFGAKCPAAEMTVPLKWYFPKPFLPLIMSQPRRQVYIP